MKKSFIEESNRTSRVLMEHEVLLQTGPCSNLLKLCYAFQTEHFLHLALEPCMGGTLHRLVKTQPGGVIDEEYVRFYAAEILLALAQLHGLGYIHRDVKPENVLIAADGHVRLADYDLCASLRAPTTRRPDDKILLVGTANYMSPNVLSGDDQNTAIDFWSLGVLIFELLFGGNPFLCSPVAAAARGVSMESAFRYVIPPEPVVTRDCRDIIEQLLQLGECRLGTRGGAAEIMQHAWFAGVDFATLNATAPPFDPRIFLTAADDTRYFPARTPKLSKRLFAAPALARPGPADLFFTFAAVTQLPPPTHAEHKPTSVSAREDSLELPDAVAGWMHIFDTRTLLRVTAWKLRWFQFDGHCLRYARSPSVPAVLVSELPLAAAVDVTPYDSCHADLVLPADTPLENVFHLVYPDRVMHFICSSSQEKERWVFALSKLVGSHSPASPTVAPARRSLVTKLLRRV